MEKDINKPTTSEARNYIFKVVNSMTDSEVHKLFKELEERQRRGRRKYERINYYRIIDYIVKDRYYRDFIQDISERGVFIKTSRQFKIHQKLKMSFMSPDHQTPFKIDGIIKHFRSEGIGIKFIVENKEQEIELTNLKKLINEE